MTSEYGKNGRLGQPDEYPVVCDECGEGPESVLLSVSVGEAVPALLCPECRSYLCTTQELMDLNDKAGLLAMKASVSYALFEIEQREKRTLHQIEQEWRAKREK